MDPDFGSKPEIGTLLWVVAGARAKAPHKARLVWCQFLLDVSREYRNIFYKKYTWMIFPYSRLTASKSVHLPCRRVSDVRTVLCIFVSYSSPNEQNDWLPTASIQETAKMIFREWFRRRGGFVRVWDSVFGIRD